MQTQASIGWAVKAMLNARRVRRRGWNGKGMWLGYHEPDEDEKMTEPFIYMRTAQGGLIPWLASQADILANDWELVG